jgi:DnaJ-class molecular chaperone
VNTCSKCGGKGWIWEMTGHDDDVSRDLCPDCNGKGKLTKEQEKELYRGYEDEEI